MWCARAEIVCRGSTGFRESFKGFYVRLSQVHDVDVIAQAGTVGRWIIVAKHLKTFAARGGVNGSWDQVDLRGVILTNLAIRVRPGGVEIAKRHGTDSV